MNESCVSVVTTIQEPTPAVLRLLQRLRAAGGRLLAIGDRKGPAAFAAEGAEFFPLDAQLALPLTIASRLPTGHYARKNIGYLLAVEAGAECIFDTDDDNAPLDSWAPRSETVHALAVETRGWVNVYRCFSDEAIWPRGFPLDAVRGSLVAPPAVNPAATPVRAPIQQGLANHSPDVDAIWRLVLDRPFEFREGPSVLLPPGSWCPFNSQSTWWWPDAFPLLYLPSHCSFRMTDIWRSFVAQRCLWELGTGVVFHSPEVVQDRNEHDLMRDFADEISGYTRNRELVRRLGNLELEPGVGAVGENLRRCYAALVEEAFFPEQEMQLVDAWLADLAAVNGPARPSLSVPTAGAHER